MSAYDAARADDGTCRTLRGLGIRLTRANYILLGTGGTLTDAASPLDGEIEFELSRLGFPYRPPRPKLTKADRQMLREMGVKP